MNEIRIREFGLLTQGDWAQEDLGHAAIASEPDWSFLEGLAYSNDGTRFIETARHDGKKALRVVNFVGVITLPGGTQIEILPKTSEYRQDVSLNRERLWKMLGAVEGLHFYEATEATLMLRNQPLLEALISTFLKHVAALVRRGLRKDYVQVEAEERFLKGRLRIPQQLRQPPGRANLFQIEYDVFSENRAENRLLHSALVRAAAWSRSEENQRLAAELRRSFEDVPASSDYRQDFRCWSTSRDMVHYRPLERWVRLILNEQCPFTLKDRDSGISFLFRMDQLFEKYVAKVLDGQLRQSDLALRVQLQGRFLSDQPKAFLLKPDLGVARGGKLISILDTKWKLIDRDTRYDSGDPDPKCGIAQSDMYQLYAYGQKYLGGQGKLVLIYPRWAGFDEPLPPFDLGGSLVLHAVPFDLDLGRCPALPGLLGDADAGRA
jgi:5-methylcytosine-specific restriction enzyme subunit McrC